MKRVVALIGVGLILFIAAVMIPSETITAVVEKEVEVTPEWASDQEAVEAAQAVIRRKELEGELETLNSEIGSLEERRTEIEKELGTYWSDPQNVKSLIRRTFPDADTALAVAKCESGFRPTAYNQNSNGSYDAGIFQINSVHQARLDELGLNKWDVEDNIKFARLLHEEQGWIPWVCYTKGLIAMR